MSIGRIVQRLNNISNAIQHNAANYIANGWTQCPSSMKTSPISCRKKYLTSLSHILTTFHIVVSQCTISLWLCVDFHGLNKISNEDHYLLPLNPSITSPIGCWNNFPSQNVPGTLSLWTSLKLSWLLLVVIQSWWLLTNCPNKAFSSQ